MIVDTLSKVQEGASGWQAGLVEALAKQPSRPEKTKSLASQMTNETRLLFNLASTPDWIPNAAVASFPPLNGFMDRVLHESRMSVEQLLQQKLQDMKLSRQVSLSSLRTAVQSGFFVDQF